MLNTTLGELSLSPTLNPAFSTAASDPGRSASGAGAADSFPNVFHNAEEVHIRINGRLTQLKAVAVGGFVNRHKQASIAVAVALLIAGGLLAGTGGKPPSSTSYPVPDWLRRASASWPCRASDYAGQGPAADAAATVRIQLKNREALRDRD